jgi:signal peptidase I
VDKLARPARWDVIVHREPEDPGVLYARRLVGLPGERVAIRDGKVLVDGRAVEPPPSAARLVYSSAPGRGYWRWLAPGAGEAAGAEGERDGLPVDPGAEWQLGEDDYFVLGDFSERSRDSRQLPPEPAAGVEGRRGRVGRGQIEGVVRYIYWPPRRWMRVE